MREGLGVLCRMLKERSLIVLEFDLWDVDVKSSSGSDELPVCIQNC